MPGAVVVAVTVTAGRVVVIVSVEAGAVVVTKAVVVPPAAEVTRVDTIVEAGKVVTYVTVTILAD